MILELQMSMTILAMLQVLMMSMYDENLAGAFQ